MTTPNHTRYVPPVVNCASGVVLNHSAPPSLVPRMTRSPNLYCLGGAHAKDAQGRVVEHDAIVFGQLRIRLAIPL